MSHVLSWAFALAGRAGFRVGGGWPLSGIRVCSSLVTRGRITAAEAAAWIVSDGQPAGHLARPGSRGGRARRCLRRGPRCNRPRTIPRAAGGIPLVLRRPGGLRDRLPAGAGPRPGDSTRGSPRRANPFRSVAAVVAALAPSLLARHSRADRMEKARWPTCSDVYVESSRVLLTAVATRVLPQSPHFCIPVHRTALSEGSQTGSQRQPAACDVDRCRATVGAGSRHIQPHRTTSRHERMTPRRRPVAPAPKAFPLTLLGQLPPGSQHPPGGFLFADLRPASTELAISAQGLPSRPSGAGFARGA
jgi:hypothetical protein